MMNNEEEKILSIRVKYTDAIDGIAKYNGAIQDLKKKQEELREELKEGGISQQEYNAEMATTKSVITEYKDNVRVLEKEIQNNMKTEKEEEGSMKGLRAELSNLTKGFDELSRSEREGAKGQDLKAHINMVTNEIRQAEEETQRYYRSVGNYENSIKGALGVDSKWYTDLRNISDVFGHGLTGGLETAGKAVSSFGKHLLSLLANPIVATIAAIVAALMLLKEGISASAANSAKLKEVLAPLKIVMEAVINVLIQAASVILTVVDNGEKLIGWVMTMAEKLPLVGDAIKSVNDKVKESIEYQKMANQYAKESRNEIVESAAREREVAELRDKVAQKGKYNAAERRSYLQQAINIERQQSAERKKLAMQNFMLLDIEFYKGNQNKDMLDRLAEAKAAVIRADTEYYNSTRRMQKELSTYDTSEASEAQQKATEAERKAKEQAKKRLAAIKDAKQKEKEAIRAAEDALYDLLSDDAEKQRERVAKGYDRKIEDLKDKLATEKNLTSKARSAMNSEIITLEEEKNKKLQEYDNNEITKKIDKEEKNIELFLQAVKKGCDKEYQLKYDQLEKQKEAEMHAADIEIATTEEKLEKKYAITQKYDLLLGAVADDQANSRIKKEQDAIKLEFETKIAEVGDNEEAVLKLKVDEAQKEYDTLQQMAGESDKDFYLRRTKAGNDWMKAKKELSTKEIEIEKAKYEAISNVMGGLVSLTDALGEHNKSFAKLSKVLALAQIAINTGQALSAGIAIATTVHPWPAMLVAISTTVATVLTNIATAIKTVNGAKFANGGLVSGSGTETSDSVPAQLSNGESVMTAAATSMFSPVLSTFNQIGGGVPIMVAGNNAAMGEEMLANAVAKGFMRAPSPVLSVEEFTRVSNRVKYIESLGNI
jgi:hypothetical protein